MHVLPIEITDAMTLKIAAISGSLRAKSYNTAVMQTLPDLAPENMSIQGCTLEAIPPYNQDIQDNEPWPEAVERLGAAVAESDGVVFVTPEYNYSIPGVLKNAIDWLSRLDPQPFKHKPAGIMGASMSGQGTSRCQYHLRQVLIFVEAITMPKPEVFIARAHERIRDGRLDDSDTRDHVAGFLVAFSDWIERVR